MSVVAWDGKTLAADRASECGGMKSPATKLRKIYNGVMAFTGDMVAGLTMMEWYVSKKPGTPYPATQATDDWARLIVAYESGKVDVYIQTETPIPLESGFMAWGSGADFAMGAMAMGANAKQAVEVANVYSTTCGLGVDAVEVVADERASSNSGHAS